MRELVWGPSFKRAFKRAVKRSPKLRDSIARTLRLLSDDPFAPSLATHKLKGKLEGSWACTAGYDLRIIFEFVKEREGEPDSIFLMEIGTHDEVY